MKFNFRIGNIELRSCDEHLTNYNEHTKAEIVWWNKDYCYTLAYYQINTEDGYSNLSFVANRPFDDKVDHQEKFVASDCTTYIREQGVKLTHRTITKELKELRYSGLIEIRPMNRGFKLSGSVQDLECKLLNNNVVGTGRWWNNNNDKIELLIKINNWVKYITSGNTKKHLF